MKRKFVETQLDYSLIFELSNKTIDEAIEHLQKIKNKHSSEFKKLYLTQGGGWDYSDLEVWGSRLETDEEVEKRLQKDKKAAEKALAKKKKALAKLAKECDDLEKKLK